MERKCPYCGSKNFDVCETDMFDGKYIEYCACSEEDCGKYFNIKYDLVVKEIDLCKQENKDAE